MCFLDGLQLWIPALCSRSLIVSTEQFSPRAGRTALAAVMGVCVAKRIIASSCSWVVALLRPHLSRVSTLPSLSNLFSHLLTVLCCVPQSKHESGFAQTWQHIIVGKRGNTHRTIDSGSYVTERKTGLEHSNHAIPDLRGGLVDTSGLAHFARSTANKGAVIGWSR